MLTFAACYCKFCSKELGVPCDPEGKRKKYNDKFNPIHNPVNNPKRHLVEQAARRADTRASTAALPNLSNILRYSDEYLRACVAMAFRRPEVMEIWAAGSFYFTYIFFWTCECGRRATTKQLKSAERKESTNAMLRTDNPLLVVPMPAWGGLPRKLVHSDIHFQGSPAVILRLAIGLCVDELAEVEREACCLTRLCTLGFAGNRRDGGTSTRPKEGSIHGVSVLVIRNLAELGLVLAPPFAPAYAARARLGSEATVMPPLPPASFVPPPCEASGAYVLGGPHFLADRGLGSSVGGGSAGGSAGGGAAGSGLPPLPVLPGAGAGGGDDDDDDDDDD
eukprot:jgi/Chrpa1/25338/Chrysochromulina_OHIO_Genome00027963-RA